MSQETVELDLYYVAETGLAYGVTEKDPEDPVIWLPKSRVEMTKDVPLGKASTFEVPEWLAIEKGLV
jgi:hypothetical protein